MLVYLCLVFFRAEDGIRDHCVTGVQTCALPILIALDALRVVGRAQLAKRARHRAQTRIAVLGVQATSSEIAWRRAKRQARHFSRNARMNWSCKGFIR